MEQHPYIIECNDSETRLPAVAQACEFLKQVAATVSAEVWVYIDRGPVQRSWLARLFCAHDRDVEHCFWLATSGSVAALTFFDEACSEYNATDPVYPVQATVEQRMALSCGEPTPAPLEICLHSDRAFAAAIEYLHSGVRPSWLTYRYVR